MPLIEHNIPPSPSMRRWFGLSLTFAVLLLAWFLNHYGQIVPSLLAICAILLGVVYYLLPASQLAIIRGWQLITFPLAFVISHILLGAVFFCIVLPLGLALRVAGHDPLRLKHNRRDTNWQTRKTHADLSRYFRQF